jgi:RNA polymerase sigma-70 factor (ECF subfamily)
MKPGSNAEAQSSPRTDIERFMELLMRHQHSLLGYIVALVHNLADADDVYQQTSLVLWEKFQDLRDDDDFLRWACTFAYYTSMNFLRTNRRRRIELSDDLAERLADVAAAASRPSDVRREALLGCLGKLSEKDRTLIDRCYERGVSIKAAADALGRPVGAVYHSLRRIRMALFQCVERSLGGEGEA